MVIVGHLTRWSEVHSGQIKPIQYSGQWSIVVKWYVASKWSAKDRLVSKIRIQLAVNVYRLMVMLVVYM